MRELFQTDDYPGTRNPRVVLGVDRVLRHKNAPPVVATLQDLKVGEQYDTGYIEGSELVSGWCSHGSQPNHEKCHRVTVGPKGQVNLCTCECHGAVPVTQEAIIEADARRRCSDCADTLGPKRWGRGGHIICAVQAECARRRKDLLRSNAVLARNASYDQLKEHSEMATRTPKEDKPKGVCEFSGAATKGGRFAPGCDAKLKSALLEAAKAGNVSATAELLQRSWPVKGIDDATVRSAKADPVDVEKRVAQRLAKIKAGVDAREAVTTQGK